MKHGEYKVPGGKLVVIDFEVHDNQLANVQLSGDFFLEPPEALDHINHALTGLAATSDAATIEAAVEQSLPAEAQLFGFDAAAVAVVVGRALA